MRYPAAMLPRKATARLAGSPEAVGRYLLAGRLTALRRRSTAASPAGAVAMRDPGSNPGSEPSHLAAAASWVVG